MNSEDCIQYSDLHIKIQDGYAVKTYERSDYVHKVLAKGDRLRLVGAVTWDCENTLNAMLYSWSSLSIPDPFVGRKGVQIWPGSTDISGACNCCSYHRIAGYDTKKPTPCAGQNPEAAPTYWFRYQPDLLDYRHPPEADTVGLEIEDPVRLNFDLARSLATDDGREHEGVTIRDIWEDPITRVAWLITKPRMLTDQFYRQACLDFKDRVRHCPPRLVEDVPIESFYEWTANMHTPLCIALYRQIVRILLDEGKWPYLMPPKWLVAEKQLTWVISIDEDKQS